jgi:hypothetical protein
MSRTLAMKAFAAGDKLCPFTSEPWRRAYTSLPVSQRSNAGSRPGSPQSRAGSSGRTKQTKKPAGVVAAGPGCSALSAGPQRQDSRNGSRKPALKPIARGEILNPIPSRPVHVMATAIVRVHRDGRNSRFRIARHDAGNNSRSMMSSVSRILTFSLCERRRTEQSDSRYCC